MLFWLYDLPLPLMAVLICLPCLAFTWGGLLVLRPRVRRWLGPQPGANELVSTFLSAYGVFYGLMLGLIAVATYQTLTSKPLCSEKLRPLPGCTETSPRTPNPPATKCRQRFASTRAS